MVIWIFKCITTKGSDVTAIHMKWHQIFWGSVWNLESINVFEFISCELYKVQCVWSSGDHCILTGDFCQELGREITYSNIHKIDLPRLMDNERQHKLLRAKDFVAHGTQSRSLTLIFAPVDLYSQKIMLEVSDGNSTCKILVFHIKKWPRKPQYFLKECLKHLQPFPQVVYYLNTYRISITIESQNTHFFVL